MKKLLFLITLCSFLEAGNISGQAQPEGCSWGFHLSMNLGNDQWDVLTSGIIYSSTYQDYTVDNFSVGDTIKIVYAPVNVSGCTYTMKNFLLYKGQDLLASGSGNNHIFTALISEPGVYDLYYEFYVPNRLYRIYINPPAVAVNNTEKTKAFNVFPNATYDFFNIELEEAEDNSFVQLYDAYGKIVWTQQLSDKKSTVDISSLPAGMYFGSLKIAQHSPYSFKIIKL